jgi:hypothetical protein
MHQCVYCIKSLRHEAASGALSGPAADAAAVASAAALAGGAAGAATAIRTTTVTDLLAAGAGAGAGGNQMDSRALRNLVLLGLRRVEVAVSAPTGEAAAADERATIPAPPPLVSTNGYTALWGDYMVRSNERAVTQGVAEPVHEAPQNRRRVAFADELQQPVKRARFADDC